MKMHLVGVLSVLAGTCVVDGAVVGDPSVSPMQSTVRSRIGLVTQFEVEGDEPAQLNHSVYEDNYNTSGYRFQFDFLASTKAGQGPSATAQTTVTATGQRFGGSTGSSYAEMEYWMVMVPKGDLPWVPTTIPIEVEVFLETSIGGTGIFSGGTAVAGSSISNYSNNTVLFSRSISSGGNVPTGGSGDPIISDSDEEHAVETVQFALNAQFYIRIVAEATASGYGTESLPGAGTASAFADPLLRFDQAAFDAMASAAGQPTFDLDTYLTIAVSEASVPEPAGVALLAVATAPCLLRRSRRRSN
jgi:hypothetical protein